MSSRYICVMFCLAKTIRSSLAFVGSGSCAARSNRGGRRVSCEGRWRGGEGDGRTGDRLDGLLEEVFDRFGLVFVVDDARLSTETERRSREGQFRSRQGERYEEGEGRGEKEQYVRSTFHKPSNTPPTHSSPSSPFSPLPAASNSTTRPYAPAS